MNTKQEQLEALNKRIKDCTLCELRETATAPVCGIGSLGAKFFLIGEAPGKTEDKMGVPFVGLAGKRLNQLLEVGKISTNICYFSNVCRCRPPANRVPKKKEIRACLKWLWEEIEIIQPSFVVTLGATPLSLFTDVGIKQLHGCELEVEIEDAKV